MNIRKEDNGKLEASLIIDVQPDDYQEKVNAVLKDYRKRASIPGFRPGHVPIGLIKKKVGSSVIAEEVNKVVNEAMSKYFEDNKVKILGQPLFSNEELFRDATWDDDQSYEFKFDIGMAPEVITHLSSKEKFTLYQIEIDDEVINKNILNVRNKYGEITEPETTVENDMLFGIFQELDKNGFAQEEGVTKESRISTQYIKDKKLKKQLIGIKKGDSVTMKIKQISDNPVDSSLMLGIDVEDVKRLKSRFSFTIEKVSRVIPAEYNQELFDKVYGPNSVKSDEEFRGKVRTETAAQLRLSSDNKLLKDIIERLIEKSRMKLPDGFLIRWLAHNSEGKLDEEQVKKEYDKYARSLKWELLVQKISEERKIEIKNEELIEEAKKTVLEYYGRYGITMIPDDDMNKIIHQILSNKEESRKLYFRILDERLMFLFKETFRISEKKITFEKFNKLASKT